MKKIDTYPTGANVNFQSLSKDPYPIYKQLREEEPVSWVACSQSWYLTRFKDISMVLRSPNFTVQDPNSLLSKVFGTQILSIDGPQHQNQRHKLNPTFSPNALREAMVHSIGERVNEILASTNNQNAIEVRSMIASRFPVLNILDFFGFPNDLEPAMRKWYDSFEKALSNFEGDEAVERQAITYANDFKKRFIELTQSNTHNDFIKLIIGETNNTDDDIQQAARNALTIFFGGISTVEALILNTIYVLCEFPDVRAAVENNHENIEKVIEETMRWVSPVQSSIRLAIKDTEINGVMIKKGETVSCMLGAANRDPEIWNNPDTFDIHRPNLKQHIGFSMGTHFCLGSHLARLQAKFIIKSLLSTCPNFKFKNNIKPLISGYEFRQPRELHLEWG